MRGWLLALLLLTPALAGCLDGIDEALSRNSVDAPDYDHLDAPDATDILDGVGTRTFIFEATTEQAGVQSILGIQSPVWVTNLEVDETVGYVEVVIRYDEADGDLFAFLADEDGRTQCGANTFGVPKRCTTPVNPGSGVAEWWVDVTPGYESVPEGMPFTLEVTLHPPSHLQVTDPTEGTDPEITFRISDTGRNGAEPTMGITSDGTLFAIEGTSLMRSQDDGRTWQEVSPPGNDQVSFDPMMRVDPYTDAVYVDHLYVGCSTLSWSEDKGETWATNQAACGAPANDHQKLAVGPNPTPAPFNAVYYAYSSIAEGAGVSRSLDGGVTWTTTPVTLDAPYRNTGPVEADREGTVFVPYYLCDGGMGVGVSNDHGATFQFQRIAEDAITCGGTHRTDADAGPAVDAAGNLYIAYRTDHAVRYVYSTDKGQSWSDPITVNPSNLESFTHVDAIAGDEGKLAIVYRATPDSALGPNSDGFAAWHLYVTFVDLATTGEPEVTTALVNDPEDPVQRGPICSMGAACAGGSRNLLDFIDIQVGPDGRVYAAYADGCDAPCPTPADSRERMGLVAILEEGPRLFEDEAPWA